MPIATMLDRDKVYSLQELQALDFTNGTFLAVIGYPVAHSISPIIHNAALAELSKKEARIKDWQYIKIEVSPEALPFALSYLHRQKFLGINLTVPYKVQAIPLLARLDPDAQQIGAVNTLLRHQDGYCGFNTDGFGIYQTIKHDLDSTLEGSTCIIIGAGGAARAAAVECLRQNCHRLWVVNRNPKNLDALHRALLPLARPRQLHVRCSQQPLTRLPRMGILINATSLGLNEGDALPIDLDLFDSSLKVFDMIYNPPITALMRMAHDRGMRTANGLTMLIEQGAQALGYWTQLRASTQVMRQAACERLNLVGHNA